MGMLLGSGLSLGLSCTGGGHVSQKGRSWTGLGVSCLCPLTCGSHYWSHCSAEMMGNPELAPEVDVHSLQPLLSPDVVSELLDTYMSTLTVSSVVIVPWRGLTVLGSQTGRSEHSRLMHITGRDLCCHSFI